MGTSSLQQMGRNVLRYPRSAYLFTCNDFKVMIIPHTLVDLLQASTSSLFISGSPSSLTDVLQRTPYVLLWNWLNLLAFNLANQRQEASIAEDKINRGWRPIASGLLTPTEARYWLLAQIPIGLTVTLLLTGGTVETMAIFIMTWMYNDLDGGNDHFAIRNGLNGLAFALHCYGSTMVAAQNNGRKQSPTPWSLGGGGGGGSSTSTSNDNPVLLKPVPFVWLAVIACVVSTTLQVQDPQDIEGDRKRGRKTIPLVWGDGPCRAVLAINMVLWSVCLVFWNLYGVVSWTLLLATGCAVAWRTLQYRNVDSDERTYKLWCAWLSMVYALPIFQSLNMSTP